MNGHTVCLVLAIAILNSEIVLGRSLHLRSKRQAQYLGGDGGTQTGGGSATNNGGNRGGNVFGSDPFFTRDFFGGSSFGLGRDPFAGEFFNRKPGFSDSIFGDDGVFSGNTGFGSGAKTGGNTGIEGGSHTGGGVPTGGKKTKKPAPTDYPTGGNSGGQATDYPTGGTSGGQATNYPTGGNGGGQPPYVQPAPAPTYRREPAGQKEYNTRPAGQEPYTRPAGQEPYTRPAGQEPYTRPPPAQRVPLPREETGGRREPIVYPDTDRPTGGQQKPRQPTYPVPAPRETEPPQVQPTRQPTAPPATNPPVRTEPAEDEEDTSSTSSTSTWPSTSSSSSSTTSAPK